MNFLYLLPPAKGHINAVKPFISHIATKGDIDQKYLKLDGGRFKLVESIDSIQSDSALFVDNFYTHNPNTGISKLLTKLLGHSSAIERKTFQDKIESLQSLLKVVSFDWLFIDVFYSYTYFMIPGLTNKIIFFNTQLNSYRDDHIAPIYTAITPHGFSSTLKIKWAWFLQNIGYNQPDILKKQWHITKSIAQKKGFSLDQSIAKNKCFQPGVREVAELILGYQSFDFERVKCEIPQYYCAIQGRSNPINRAKDQKVLNYILQQKVNPSQKFIYCSLGTLNYSHNNNSKKVFEYLLELASAYPNWIIIISSGQLKNAYQYERSENIIVRSYLPQTALLPHVDMMITHAGANSVYECILSSTPMYAIPLNATWDQLGNAIRIKAKNIGLYSSIENVSKEEMELSINKILGNEGIKNSINELREKLNKEYEDSIIHLPIDSLINHIVKS